jgi:hypothetical protein
MKMSPITILLGAFLTTTALMLAQTTTTPPPLPPESHQFDFWLGDWDVFNQQGTREGQSHIESIAEGNGVLENWTDASGTTGKSLNVYNIQKKCWQQFWVGNGTPVLEMSGGIVNGSMVLTGDRPGQNGAKVVDRIIWTPNADGTVRQHWEISQDGGQTWRDNFDGIYRRKQKP